jgi:hypothetical protein
MHFYVSNKIVEGKDVRFLLVQLTVKAVQIDESFYRINKSRITNTQISGK